MKKYKPKYEVGDIVGVCGGAMFEFEIVRRYPSKKAYAGKCVRTYVDSIKKGEMRSFLEKQAIVKLGSKGAYDQLPPLEPAWLSRFPPRMRKSLVASHDETNRQRRRMNRRRA